VKNLAKGIYKIKGALQNYAWGGKHFIAELLNVEQKQNEPIAEYWLGVHQRGEAKIKIGQNWESLSQYAKLPYLFKILDVNKMLSIQSHPNKKQAKIGFKYEEEKGIPIDAKHRVFKDDNHKPELMVALSDFWLLHGFQSIPAIQDIIKSVPEFEQLLSKATAIESFYTYLMQLSNDEVKAILLPLENRLETENPTDKNLADYWALQAFKDYGYDKGIFSIYFYNLVYLKKGQAIYQEAGIPHAYLEGQNVEIMANSDNVFRAGLTPKHIDIDLLLNHLDFSAVDPIIIEATTINENSSVYKSVAKEFELQWITIENKTIKIGLNENELYFVLDGLVSFKDQTSEIQLNRGESLFCNYSSNLTLSSNSNSTIVKVTIPY